MDIIKSLTHKLLPMACLIAGMASCSDEYTGALQVTTNPKYLNVDKSSLTYQSSGGTQQLGIQSIGTSWTLKNIADWITLGTASGSGSTKVNVNVVENTEYSDRGRATTVTLSGDGCSDRFISIMQESPALLLDAYPLTATMPASASTAKINVNSNSVWTVSVAYDWLNATPSGNAILLSAKENTTGSDRENTVSIQSGSKSVKVSVVQKAAVTTVSPQTLDFDYGASSQNITVASDVSWTATKAAEYDWITLSTTSAPAGTSTVKVAVTGNAAESPRSGTFSIGNTVVTVNQKAFKSELSVSPTSLTMKGSADKANLTVTSNGEWNYTMTDAQWLTVARATTGLQLSATENATESTRTAIINITSGTKAVSVEVKQLPATLTGLTDQVSFGYAASSKSFTISSEAAWKATTNNSWIQISPSSGKAGNTALKISVTENSSKEARTGSFSVNNKTVSVSQEGVLLAHSPDKLMFSEEGETQQLTINSNTSWTLTPSKDWILLDKKEGNGNATVKVTVGKNTAEPRDGRILIESRNGVKEEIDVEQSGMGMQILSLTPFAVEGDKIVYEPGSLQFSPWRAAVQDGVTWIHLSPASGNSSAKLTITVDKTNDINDRTGYVDLTFENGRNYRLVINQYGAGLVCETARYAFFAKGGTSEALTIKHKGEVSASSSANWLTARLSGDLLTLTAAENLTGSARQANVTLTLVGTTSKVDVTVTQASQHGDFTVSGYDSDVDLLPAEPVAVDLGLSVKWATFNVGAHYPEEYGDYYAWGETETKATYNWSTYKWCNGSSKTLTKYCTDSDYGTVDNKKQLDLQDDVAHVKWGGSWRMPTHAEQDDLRTKCTWTWTTQNGVDGYKVTSKTNGNSIFLPAANYRTGSSSSNSGWAYYTGMYWASSLGSSIPYSAFILYFDSGSGDRYYSIRASGFSVRPVCP